MKKIFLFLFITVFVLCSCSKDSEPEFMNEPPQEETTYDKSVRWGETCVVDSLNINGNEVQVIFSDCGKYIRKIIYRLDVYNEFNEKVYMHVEHRDDCPNKVESFIIPQDSLKYIGNYKVNVGLRYIEYIICDTLKNMYAPDIDVSKIFYVNTGEVPPTYNTYFKLLTNNYYKDNNTINLKCDDNYFELNYESDYTNDNIEIYYDNELYNNYSNNYIRFNIGYNTSSEKVYHNVKIKNKNSETYLYDITIIQNEFNFDTFFKDKFSLSYGGYVIEVTSTGSFQGNVYNLNNNSLVDIKVIQCKVYINNTYQTTITGPIKIKAGDKTKLFGSRTNIDLKTVTLELIFEFNGNQYTMNI